MSVIVAYHGEVEFDGCFWDDQSGWRIRWRLIGTPGSLEKANPMKRFTKRRGDRVGTRFHASMAPIAFGKEDLSEVMLVAWSDSTSGWSATFEYAEEPVFAAGCLRKAKDRVGTRFAMTLAEIDSDDNVVNQAQRERVENAQRPGAHLLSNRAAMLVKNHMFHEWLRENIRPVDWGETSADAWLKNYLSIASKAELDDGRNARAVLLYNQLIQRFEEWRDGPTRTPF